MEAFISSFEIQAVTPQFVISNIEVAALVDDYRKNNFEDSDDEQKAHFLAIEASHLERRQMTYN